MVNMIFQQRLILYKDGDTCILVN